jgi:hypothetical protein
MLKLTIASIETYDEVKNEFLHTKEYNLQLEHSLVSLSKWESKWCKSFLKKEEKTIEESIDYIRCMTLTQNVDPEAYNYLTQKNLDEVTSYIEAPMTATTFSKEENQKSINRTTITAEIIYYWMVALNIPFECQKWHLSRLLTLINVCNIKNQPPKKRSRHEVMSRNAALNAANRNKYNSRG